MTTLPPRPGTYDHGRPSTTACTSPATATGHHSISETGAPIGHLQSNGCSKIMRMTAMMMMRRKWAERHCRSSQHEVAWLCHDEDRFSLSFASSQSRYHYRMTTPRKTKKNEETCSCNGCRWVSSRDANGYHRRLHRCHRHHHHQHCLWCE